MGLEFWKIRPLQGASSEQWDQIRFPIETLWTPSAEPAGNYPRGSNHVGFVQDPQEVRNIITLLTTMHLFRMICPSHMSRWVALPLFLQNSNSTPKSSNNLDIPGIILKVYARQCYKDYHSLHNHT
ncbi:hypothetical protein FRC03_001800 [Tulasnella sp. 419]|nr:hypothetical protein FRC02_002046 [Tulasnella sp. 418]KAG8945149.1 hypothetical protein FRC03_001800 [Tulasnella sp. 419]